MRIATLLLLCLSVSGCASGNAYPPPDAAPSAARSSSSAAGARGGAGTAAWGATTNEPAPARVDTLTQARADCWMKVESQKGLRDIDHRIAFVDKCVAEQVKSKPN